MNANIYFNEDQREEKLLSKENLKLVSDNEQQRKRNKIYGDVVVTFTDHLELCFKTKNENDANPNRSNEGLKMTVQK